LAGHDIIVIGASAGGVEALSAVVRELPADLPAAVFVVLHMPAQSPSLLAKILDRSAKLPATQAVDDEPIRQGHIYVAAPDCHLLVQKGHVHVKRGPKENRHRPAIDPLFRSAARAYGPRVIGVVLTGALDDGTAGLKDIKRLGGLAVVQDPDDAYFPSMPRSAIQNVEVDHVKPLSQIGSLLAYLAHTPAEEEGAYPVPEEMSIEVESSQSAHIGIETMNKLGTPSYYSCPECHGTLWELGDDNFLRFRCHVGHAFTAESLQADHSESLEEALYAALRALEESASLARRLAERAERFNHEHVRERYLQRAQQTAHHADIVRGILESGEKIAEVSHAR
jgi:two-component system, chemotaxis family, protein-glutamate methylesterase/glutaminase